MLKLTKPNHFSFEVFTLKFIHPLEGDSREIFIEGSRRRRNGTG